METGTLVSGLGHAGLILWVILGDFLFSPQDVPPVAVTSVSLLSTAEYEELAAVASSPTPTPEVAPEPEPVPEPVPEPEPQPEPEPTPEPEPELAPEVQPPPPLEPTLEPDLQPAPVPQPEEVPEPVAPLAEVEQPLASDSPTIRPKPRPADRVAPDPEPTPEPEAVTDAEPTPAVSDTPTETPVVEEEPTTEAVAEEAGDILRTEATEDQEEALGMTTSPRPRSRPAATSEAQAEEPAAETETADAADPAADAIAAALAEATASDATEQSERPAGPPMSRGEQDALRVAVAACWSVGSVSSEAMRTTVTVRVDMEPNGRPVPSSIRMTGFEGGSDASAKIMFDAARRAIIRCTKDGYPLPSDKYETWRDLELVFDPTGMVLR